MSDPKKDAVERLRVHVLNDPSVISEADHCITTMATIATLKGILAHIATLEAERDRALAFRDDMNAEYAVLREDYLAARARVAELEEALRGEAEAAEFFAHTLADRPMTALALRENALRVRTLLNREDT